MNIDWASLGLVAIVTIAATVLIVSIVSGGALMLDRAHARSEAGKDLSLIHISEPTRLHKVSRMPSSA